MTYRYFLIAICIVCLAVSSMAETPAEPRETSVSDFLTPDGRYDIEAARQAGFEGSLDLEGFDVQFDPRTGEPLFSTSAAVNSPSDHPDDIYWDNSISPSVAGIGGGVYAATVYNSQLVVGGNFQVAEDSIAYYIASWDGSSWSPLGSGMNWAVQALTVYDGNLITGEYYQTAESDFAFHLVGWDGSEWQPLSSAMNDNIESETKTKYHTADRSHIDRGKKP